MLGSLRRIMQDDIIGERCHMPDKRRDFHYARSLGHDKAPRDETVGMLLATHVARQRHFCLSWCSPSTLSCRNCFVVLLILVNTELGWKLYYDCRSWLNRTKQIRNSIEISFELRVATLANWKCTAWGFATGIEPDRLSCLFSSH